MLTLVCVGFCWRMLRQQFMDITRKAHKMMPPYFRSGQIFVVRSVAKAHFFIRWCCMGEMIPAKWYNLQAQNPLFIGLKTPFIVTASSVRGRPRRHVPACWWILPQAPCQNFAAQNFSKQDVACCCAPVGLGKNYEHHAQNYLP